MTLSEIVSNGGVCILVLMALVEIAPIKINPWSAIAKWFGNTINGDIRKDISVIKGEIENMKEEDLKRDALNRRIRILSFSDDLYQGKRHSKENFDQVLLDISEYKNYCESHPGFKNDVAVMAIKSIESNYATCMAEHSFL